MSGFASLGSALSALRYNQIAMDVAAGNVSNVDTPGYARRRVVGQSVGASAVPALWSRWDGASGGVNAGPVQRVVDPFLDARARFEHANSFSLDTRAASLVRLETSIGEPGNTGVAYALSEFQKGWADLASSPDGAARSQLLSRANTLTATLGAQARAVTTEWSDQRDQLNALVGDINTMATDLAKVNKSIQTATAAGTPTDALQDQRDQLMLGLSEAAGATATTNSDGTVDVRIGTATLVSGSTAYELEVGGAATLGGVAGDPIGFSVGGTAVTVTTGAAAGMRGLLNTDLPSYLTKLDAVAVTIAANVNDVYANGYNSAGETGGVFFTGTTAAGLTVAVTDPTKLAANGAAGTLDGEIATAIANGPIGKDAYRALVTDFGSTVASARRTAENQGVLTNQVDASRESLSGINIDEEMVSLMASQRAYEGAARVITTIDSILDTLINRTGLTR